MHVFEVLVASLRRIEPIHRRRLRLRGIRVIPATERSMWGSVRRTMARSLRCQFETKYFPLVVVQAPEAIDEDGIRDMFARFDELYKARKRFVTVMDCTNTRELPSPKLRKLLSELSQASSGDARQWGLGTAMVVTSPVIRGLFTAVMWVAPSPTPTVNVATLREGIDWGLEKLQAAGIAVPAEATRYRDGLK
jgi:hypothetical protein